MRLRHRLLGLFGLFAVLPLLAIGAVGYARALRSLEALVTAEAAEQAKRITSALRIRLDRMESDIALLTRNEETQQLLASLANGDEAGAALQRQITMRYLDELWLLIRDGYHSVALRDATDATLWLQQDTTAPGVRIVTDGVAPLVRSISGPDGVQIGELELHPRTSDLMPASELEDGFGERRLNLILHRDAQHRLIAIAGPQSNANVAPQVPARPEEGSVGYTAEGERRIAAFVHLAEPPWTIVATSSIDEFAAPFLRQRVFDLGLLLFVVAAVSLGFFLLLRRTTRPLDQLSAAAASFGRGDLLPELPPAGADEVGNLTRAFGEMALRVREMLAQVEASRQTAAVGRFALELAHEIRNPLTSVKLNLQALERSAREGTLASDDRVPVQMALREIRRIDQALRTALRVGRPSLMLRPYDVRAVLDEAITLLQSEAEAHHVAIEAEWLVAGTTASGDPEAVRGVFVNLMLNAIQAVSSSGTGAADRIVHVRARAATLPHDEPAVEISVRDHGPGILAEHRDLLFHPFFTTKEQGTGLGLSVALHAVQAMGGTLRSGAPDNAGAEFIVTLPLITSEESVA